MQLLSSRIIHTLTRASPPTAQSTLSTHAHPPQQLQPWPPRSLISQRGREDLVRAPAVLLLAIAAAAVALGLTLLLLLSAYAHSRCSGHHR